MERKTAGLIGALAGLATMGSASAQAASSSGAMPPEPMQITSYSDLLRPIPNAAALLQAHDAELQERARNAPVPVESVQYYPYGGGDHHHHHHHHHHHEYYAPPPPPPPYYHHHHHHHHHHSGAVILLPGVGIQVN